LVVGSNFGIVPWMVRGASGPEGFGVDLMNELARRRGRPGVEFIDINLSGLFAALFAKRFEFTANPLNVTAERAERMLYIDPFFATGNGAASSFDMIRMGPSDGGPHRQLVEP
jgi:polar amino acid transport system substrate-binding protein